MRELVFVLTIAGILNIAVAGTGQNINQVPKKNIEKTVERCEVTYTEGERKYAH